MTQSEVAQDANKASTCDNSSEQNMNPKPSDDQHEWDEHTFQQRVEAALMAQKVPIDDHQRAQLTESQSNGENIHLNKEEPQVAKEEPQVAKEINHEMW